MPSYIYCSGIVSETNNGQWTRCRTDEATVLTESETEALFSPPMTAEQAYLASGVIFTCCLLSWGIKLGLKQLNIGI